MVQPVRSPAETRWVQQEPISQRSPTFKKILAIILSALASLASFFLFSQEAAVLFSLTALSALCIYLFKDSPRNESASPWNRMVRYVRGLPIPRRAPPVAPQRILVPPHPTIRREQEQMARACNRVVPGSGSSGAQGHVPVGSGHRVPAPREARGRTQPTIRIRPRSRS